MNFLQLFQEKRGAKSLNEALNLILDFLSHNEKLDNALDEKYPLLKTKFIKLTDENKREIKIFLSDDELKVAKILTIKNNFFSVNKFAKIAFLNYFYNDDFLTNEMIREFAHMNNQIICIGINLEIFLKAIQQNEFVYFEKGAIDELVKQIKIEANNVSKFIKEQKRILNIKLRKITYKEKLDEKNLKANK